MKPLRRLLWLILLVTLLSVGYVWWQERAREAQAPPAVVDVAPTPGLPSEPIAPVGPRYPIPEPAVPSASDAGLPPPLQVPAPQAAVTPAAPLPLLNDSNPAMTGVFTGLFGAEMVGALFNADERVRRFVVTVDNLPNRKLPRQQLLVKRVTGPFLVAVEGEGQVIAPENAARYAPYVQLAARIDARQLVEVYVRFYPLFQEAYAELGNPQAYFNDRLIEVIDHLLATPTVTEPLRVVQPKVFYEYADPALEALSAGQKILLRMGNANAEVIKARLLAIRQVLVEVSMPPGGEDAAEPMPDPVMRAPEGDWKIVP